MMKLVVFAFCIGYASAAAMDLGRVINGDDAGPDLCSSMCAMYYDGSFSCGCAVIHEDWVITAAHCLEGRSANRVTLQLGVNNRNTHTGVTVNVDSITLHDSYNSGSGAYPNDVALIRLNSRTSVPAIRIGTVRLNGDDKCHICGFGRNESGSITIQLQYANVSTLSDNGCTSEWSTNYNPDTHVCVNGEPNYANGAGACNGDSGGPLVCNGLLAGVTSWGRSGCHVSGTVTHPSVYARLSSYVEWVRETCSCI